MAESGEQLQKLPDAAILESERMGLSLNVQKTECVVISKKSSNRKCNLVSKGEKIKQVTKFKYLGYLITSDDRCTSEISKRIAMTKDTFQKMKPILTNRNISMTFTTKIRICLWKNIHIPDFKPEVGLKRLYIGYGATKLKMFPRAKLRRFNEASGNTPGVGSYNIAEGGSLGM
ncbi:RNA-directed DNA polymerase from mobile element jockey-like [Plakobranchus ocellatus]|uniref:RNA-directed DNA polymerase from mobile element jockey-like n=1 Tax=Plakobranchus ocellatus TaxID=259542 RepID=A0AAV3Y868_9GAST|nr:RNA-directed DNA polymerase from mobile element jockey-like [Plakobranchus ocellatus]